MCAFMFMYAFCVRTDACACSAGRRRSPGWKEVNEGRKRGKRRRGDKPTTRQVVESRGEVPPSPPSPLSPTPLPSILSLCLDIFCSYFFKEIFCIVYFFSSVCLFVYSISLFIIINVIIILITTRYHHHHLT